MMPNMATSDFRPAGKAQTKKEVQEETNDITKVFGLYWSQRKIYLTFWSLVLINSNCTWARKLQYVLNSFIHKSVNQSAFSKQNGT